ncbi:beta-phosphoglucomutase [Planococcus glaciei]|uniref:beta-phosphoglucomutase n=1 Tax=Planococcus glaciei TaxID=459472 RepID=UPI0009458B3A|nr:beta-phosphoglucomutase [Planococcus glaciei]
MSIYPKAFIYDLDGVITDTAEFHFLAWQKIAQKLDISIDRQFNEQLKGIGRMDSLELILKLDPSLSELSNEEKENLANRKNELYLELVETIDSSNVLPGIEELLAANKEQGLKIALGSASKNALYVLDQLGLTHYFDYIVDASQVSKGKPDPETFTAAADALGIEYPACIGIEDSAAGVAAINAANMFSVGVGDAAQLSDADYLVEATSQLDFEEIVERYRHQTALKETDQ